MPALRFEIACLCAAWCRTCDGYAETFEAVRQDLAAELHELRWHWIDIEDEAELLGDLDIETFPTLLIADAERVRFAGPLTPQAETLRRLLRATIAAADDAHWPASSSAIEALAAQLRQRPDPKPPG